MAKDDTIATQYGRLSRRAVMDYINNQRDTANLVRQAPGAFMDRARANDRSLYQNTEDFWRGAMGEAEPQADAAARTPSIIDGVPDDLVVSSYRSLAAAPDFNGTGMPRTTDPTLRARQDAEDAAAAAAKKKADDDEMARHVMHAFRDPKTGVLNVSNITGAPGDVVMSNGASTGPDIGAPGRGGFMVGGGVTSDGPERTAFENNLYGGSPEERAALEKSRADEALYETLAKSPFARDYVLGDIQNRQQQNAIDRTYGQERAKQTAKLEAVGHLDDLERQAVAGIDAGVIADMKAKYGLASDLEAKQRAVDEIREWRARQETALGMRDRPDAL